MLEQGTGVVLSEADVLWMGSPAQSLRSGHLAGADVAVTSNRHLHVQAAEGAGGGGGRRAAGGGRGGARPARRGGVLQPRHEGRGGVLLRTNNAAQTHTRWRHTCGAGFAWYSHEYSGPQGAAQRRRGRGGRRRGRGGEASQLAGDTLPLPLCDAMVYVQAYRSMDLTRVHRL